MRFSYRYAGLCCIALAISFSAFAQRENYTWYFGNKAGISFNTSPPSALSDGSMSTTEGCGAISDAEGNLLFYTDGINVYNRLHQIMPNGADLLGDPSSTQCGVIQRKPGDKNRYYIFSIDDNGGSFTYSVVDMQLDGGLGDVVSSQKNIMLASTVTEKLVLIRKSTSAGYWIIAHEDQSDEFLLYTLDALGVSSVPLKIKAGTRHGGNRAYMRASADGSLLACVYTGPQTDLISAGGNKIDLFKFNRSTGNLILLHTFTHMTAYGLEFSPTGKYLYSSQRFSGTVYQHDLSDYTSTLIASNVRSGALQNGPDGKMYLAQQNSYYLGVIEFPDKPGSACGFKANAFYLDGMVSTEGLPGFTTRPLDFYYSDTCFGEATQFALDGVYPGSIVKWRFSDIPGKDTASSLTPAHTFSKPGIYKIEVIVTQNSVNDTLTRFINIGNPPQPLKQSKERICPGDSVLLDAENADAAIMWNTGSAQHAIWVKHPGLYIAKMQRENCIMIDTIMVEVKDTVSVNLGPDSGYCADEIAELDAGGKADAYLWSTGEISQKIKVKESATISVIKTLEGCTVTDTVKIHFYPAPAKIVTDTFLCESFNDSILLVASTGKNYIWSVPGQSGNSLLVKKAGTYSVTYNYGARCPITEVFHVKNNCPYRLYVPTAFHPGGEVEANCFFRPYGVSIARYEMKIFNRWGELLFTAKSVEEGWDGTFKGQLCPEGVYLYYIFYSGSEQSRLVYESLSGTVMLLR